MATDGLLALRIRITAIPISPGRRALNQLRGLPVADRQDSFMSWPLLRPPARPARDGPPPASNKYTVIEYALGVLGPADRSRSRWGLACPLRIVFMPTAGSDCQAPTESLPSNSLYWTGDALPRCPEAWLVPSRSLLVTVSCALFGQDFCALERPGVPSHSWPFL